MWRASRSFATRIHLVGDIAWGVGVMAAALACAVPVLELWRADLSVPLAYSGDASGGLALMKGIVEHGWYTSNSNLGAPFGMELYDFPVLNADTLNVLVVKFLSLFSSEAAVVVNVYFLLMFPVIALASFVVMRRLAVTAPVAAVLSLLFVFLPYHLRRGEHHLFPSAYFAVPLAAYLILAVLSETPLFLRNRRFAQRRVLAIASPTTLATLGICLIVATSAGSFAYAPFTIVLVALATLVRLPGASSRRATALTGMAVSALLAVILVIQLTPVFVYRLHHEPTRIAARDPGDTERYSLKLAELVLPVEGHRIRPLAHLTARYRSSTPLPGEFGQSLGVAGSVGLLWLMFVLVSSTLAGAAIRRRALTVPRYAAVGALLAFLTATVGGFDTLIAYLVTPQVRVWDRMVVFIAFFAFLGVAYLLDGLGRTCRKAVFATALVVVLLGGLLDETNAADIPPYRTIKAEFRDDAVLVSGIERMLPRRSMVYEMPYVPFPENNVSMYGMSDYDLAKPYVHSRDLRWSYGAIKNGPDDWAAALARQPVRVQVAAAAAAGFDAIYVDTYGFADQGRAIVDALRSTLRERALRSPSGRRAVFDIRPYKRRLFGGLTPAQKTAARAAALEPVRAFWGNELYPEETDRRNVWRWSRQPDIALRILNPSTFPRRISLRGSIASGDERGAPTRITYPDGTESTFGAGVGTPVSSTFALRPGWHEIRISSTATPAATSPSDTRTLYLRMMNLRLSDLTFKSLRRSGFAPLTARLTIS